VAKSGSNYKELSGAKGLGARRQPRQLNQLGSMILIGSTQGCGRGQPQE